jgi:hypothetical protein
MSTGRSISGPCLYDINFSPPTWAITTAPRIDATEVKAGAFDLNSTINVNKPLAHITNQSEVFLNHFCLMPPPRTRAAGALPYGASVGRMARSPL